MLMSNPPPLVKKIVKYAKQQHEKWEKLPSRSKTKVLRILIAVGFANLIYSLFGLYTILSMGVFLAGVGLLVKLRLEAAVERGLLTFTSKKMQKALLERSIFDFLCDLWFMPKIGLYLKAIFRPFIVAINPEEAAHQFDDLPESAQRFFLQKGIVNVLPKKLRNAVLPKAHRLVNSACDEDSANEQQEERSIEGNSSQRITPSSSSQALNSESGHRAGEKIKETEITSSKQKASFLSTDEEPISALQEKINKSSKSRRKSAELKLPKKSYIFDPVDSNGNHSEIITSSGEYTKKSLTQQDSVKWDKLDFFLKVYQQKLKEKQNRPKKAAPLKGPLQMVDKLRNLAQMSKKGVFPHINEKKLLRVFCLSTIALLLQFVISKKTRKMVYTTLHVLAVAVGVLLSTGTFALYAIKKKKLRAEQQARNSANTEEETAPLAH